MNCQHNPDGWCLDCVQKLEEEKQKYKTLLSKSLKFILEYHPDLLNEPVLKDGKLENFMPKVNWEFFRCECGCNVFHKPNKLNLDLFECNGCQEWYWSE